jgi:hypothetical protein
MLTGSGGRMKIIRNFYDYYDSVQTYYSSDIVYKRTEKKGTERQFKSITEQYTFTEPFLRPFENKDFIYLENFNWCTIHYRLVGFCGIVYPFMQLSSLTSGLDISFYNSESFLEFITENRVKERKNKYRTIYSTKNFLKLFFSVREKNDFFLEHKIPIFTTKKGDIYFNNSLKEVEFYKVKDAYSTYQELEAYLDNYFFNVEPEMININDKTKLYKHGFDDWSFKKINKKRRKK